MSIESTALHKRAARLREEFAYYADTKTPPENPCFEHDLNCQFGAQLIAARLGYRIFIPNSRSDFPYMGESECPVPNYSFIRKMWDAEHRGAPVAAALRASRITVVEICDRRDNEAFKNLARYEDFLELLPRTRIVETPKGFHIHMRGVTKAPRESLGAGLKVMSHDAFAYLPGSYGDDGSYRWLRAGDLAMAPDWVLDRRVTPRETKGAGK